MKIAQSQTESEATGRDRILGQVIAGLSAPGVFPHEAVKLAAEHWELVLPRLLERLDTYLADPAAASEEDADLLFLFFHLCGQQRETRAYRPLMRLCALPRQQMDPILGDAATVTLSQVVASVFDGDPAPMQAVILDAGAEQFVRAGLLESLAILSADGRIPRADVSAFLIHCNEALQPRRNNYVWIGWQSAISYLGLRELREMVRQAFADDRIGLEHMDFEDFENDLAAIVDGVGRHMDAESFRYFGDVAEEIGHWHGFTPEAAAARLKARDRDDFDAMDALDDDTIDDTGLDVLGSPIVNPLRHIGRNDLCPCGSGKKYKRCCLR